MLEAFQTACVNSIDGWAHEHEVSQVWSVADHTINRVFQKPRISEVKALINTDRQCTIRGHDSMTIDVSIMLRPWHLTDNREVRAACIVKMEQKRDRNAGGHAELDPENQCDKDCRRHSCEVAT